jgi:DNA-binding MarR family transcriptional regulator
MPATFDACADPSWRTLNLGALLFAARDRCVSDKLTVLHARGFGAVTNAQLALFHHLDASGSRLTDIAIGAGLTKSSVSELVERAVAFGLVMRVPDQADRRAKLVSYTPDGIAFLDQLDAAIAFADQQFVRAVGDDAARRSILALARCGGSPPMVPDGADPNIGRLLAGAAKQFVRHVLDTVNVRGTLALGEPQLTLFRTLNLAGSRLTELAVRAGVTKQSMRETVEQTVAAGYLEQRPDHNDGRARLITLTLAGMVVLDHFREGVASAERLCAALLGDLRAQLITYIAASDQAKLRPTNQ